MDTLNHSEKKKKKKNQIEKKKGKWPCFHLIMSFIIGLSMLNSDLTTV